MEQTLYGDVLFLVNFTMDFLTLYITASILKRKIRTLRLGLSSGIGALYGVAACFMSGDVLFLIAVNIAVSFLMCLIAFDRRILPCCALFYGVGCLLGGFMTALFGFMKNTSGAPTVYVDGSYRAIPSEIPLGWMAAVAACIGIAAIAGGRYCKKSRDLDCTVTVVTENGSFVFDGITDSGNLLTDPISGRAVIIIKKDEFLKLVPSELFSFYDNEDVTAMPDLPPSLSPWVKLVPSTSLGGSKLLLCYLPKAVTVDGIERSALIAMGNGDGFNGRAALVPMF